MPGNGGRLGRGASRVCPPGGDRVDVERGLGVEGFVEGFFGSIPHELGEGEAEEGVGFFEGLAGEGVLGGKVFAHAKRLGALPGEDEGGGLGVEFHEVSVVEGRGRVGDSPLPQTYPFKHKRVVLVTTRFARGGVIRLFSFLF